MRKIDLTRWLGMLIVASVALAAPAGAGAAGQVATASAGGDAVVWQPQIGSYDRLVLTVSGPGGSVTRGFRQGDTPSYPLFDAAGNFAADGAYKWELRVIPRIDAATRQALAQDRAAGSTATADRLRAEGALPAVSVQNGYFRILDGAVVMPGDFQEASASASAGMTAGSAGAMTPLPADVVLTNADGVIRNSLCVGLDCPDAPSFSDTTILMMENNTRIKFDDTSVSPFPLNDWEIEANSNLSGGPNQLVVNDCGTSSQGGCATDPLFVIEAGARANALFVESDGDIGVGTANPVLDLHIVTGNTPAIRLDQDGSSGFTAQVWDIAGNEASFFVRDVTGGSTLPFRIVPGAPSSSLIVASDGDVGIGTLTPDATSNTAVHIKRTNSTELAAILQTNGVTTRFRLINDTAVTNGQRTWSVAQRQNGRFAIIQDGAGGNDAFSIDNNGDILVAGTVVHSSSRATKRDIVPIDPSDVLNRVLALPLAEWSYDKADPGGRHMGPMAEDFWSLFQLGPDDKHIALNDTSGVALAAIQGLNRVIAGKDAEIADLQQRLAALESVVAGLAARSTPTAP